MLKPLQVILALTILATIDIHAGPVLSRELTLFNKLGVKRDKELVTVSLYELAVPVDQSRRIRDVRITDGIGRSLPCQYDDFSQFEGMSSEVVFEVSLKPLERRSFKLEFLDMKRTEKPVCIVRKDGKDMVIVKTPAYTAPVRSGNGLTVEEPRFELSGKKKDDDAIDDLLGDLENDPAGKEDVGSTVKGNTATLRPPMSGKGLPFCVRGVSGFKAKSELKTWGGRLRSVVALYSVQEKKFHKNISKLQMLQFFWFPRSGKRFFLDFRVVAMDPIEKGRLTCGSIRVNSADHPWQVIWGQDGKPPYVPRVKMTLRNTRKSIYLEGYQKSSFNDKWVQLVSKKAWLTMLIDRENSVFGKGETSWDTGLKFLDNRIAYSDDGPYSDSIEDLVNFESVPVGAHARVRTAFYFGAKESPEDDMKLLSQKLNSALPVCWVRQRAVTKPDLEKIGKMLHEHTAMVVVPDYGTDRDGLWCELAARLGGAWCDSRKVLQYYNVTHKGKLPKDMLTVLVGEPGGNYLLDQLNRRYQFFNPYPSDSERSVTTYLGNTPELGCVLVLAGNSEHATGKAVNAFMQHFEPVPVSDIALSQRHWTGLMPFLWSGANSDKPPFRTLAYRNGYADYLFLLRANQDLKGIRFETPEGAECRFVPWKFSSDKSGKSQTKPFHDAAFPGMPSSLDANQLLGIWIRFRIPKDSETGTRKEMARLSYNGKTLDIPLETEVLSPVLSGKQVFGFNPMGFNKESIEYYYGWDDQTYYAGLADLLKQRGRFGGTSYTLDVNGIKFNVDDEGKLTIDSSEFEKELSAVNAAGCIRYMELKSFNYLMMSDGFRKLMRTHQLTDRFKAWELVVPELRKTFRKLEIENKIVCRHGDEIADYELWNHYADLYKRCGVKMTVAINGYGVFNKHLAVGYMGFWIPLYNFFVSRWGKPIADDDPEIFSKQFRDERHKAGEEIWPYVCGPGPYAWSPRPRSQARFLIIDTYMKGADGLSYYGGTSWSHALSPEYRDKIKADLFDIDATFVSLYYPDAEKGTILPSLRSGIFRIGLDDIAAIQALRELAAKKGESAEIERKLRRAFGTLTMASSQQEFDEFQRQISRLYAGLDGAE